MNNHDSKTAHPDGIILHFLIFSFLFIFGPTSHAGFRDDHALAWVNLDGASDHFRVDQKIIDFANSDRIDSMCGINWTRNSSVLYIKTRPKKLTDSLLHRVFFDQEKSAFKELSDMLRSFRDENAEVHDGLDGVMIYSSKNGPRMMSFTKGKKKVVEYSLKSNSSKLKTNDIEEAFCALMPPITRAP
jgi:hypothetical protein